MILDLPSINLSVLYQTIIASPDHQNGLKKFIMNTKMKTKYRFQLSLENAFES